MTDSTETNTELPDEAAYRALALTNDPIGELVDWLADATRQRKIEWERAEQGKYMWKGQAGWVVLWEENATRQGQASVDEWRAGAKYLLTLQDPEERPILTMSHHEFPPIRVLFEVVRRTLFAVDHVTSLLISEIRSGMDA